MVERLTDLERAAIVAHFSYELEPTTPLPDWNTVAMETVHLRNEVAALRAALDAAQADKARAVEAERERCAQVAETRGNNTASARDTRKYIAAAIRTGGKP